MKEALTHVSPSIRLETIYLCYNFIDNSDNLDLINHFVSTVSLVTRLTDSFNLEYQPETIKVSLQIIELILRKESTNRGSTLEENFSEKFEKAGGLEALEELQLNSNKCLVKCAKEIIERYFGVAAVEEVWAKEEP